MATFTFSEFEPRQRLSQSQKIFDDLLGYILLISKRMQKLSNYSKRFKSYRHFLTFFTNRPASKSSQTFRWQNQMTFDYRALYDIQLQVSVDFLRVVQSTCANVHCPVSVDALQIKEAEESNCDKVHGPTLKTSEMYFQEKFLCNFWVKSGNYWPFRLYFGNVNTQFRLIFLE